MPVDAAEINRLRHVCLEIRRDIVTMIHIGGSGHPGGALSAVEILVALYFKALNIRPGEPSWGERDRFVLSKGHAAPALYAALAERGFFPKDELKTFTMSGTRLQKHLDMHLVPGVEVSSGSLGQGLSVAIGMALADRLDGKDRRVYVLLGDGESQEGQVWEAAMAAAHFKLDYLTAFLDCNGLQVDGPVREVMDLAPLESKWQSFGWHVLQVDGHDLGQILEAVEIARHTPGRPHMILAETVKGKGISYMENRFEWHSRSINDEEYQIAMAELAAEEQRLVAGEGTR